MEPLEHNETVSRWAGLKTRALSAAAIAVVFLGVLWAGGWWFSLLVILAGLQMLREWDGLTLDNSMRWMIAGLFYIAIPCAALIWLRGNDIRLVLFVLLAVSATDTGAYFTGRKIGGPKLAPAISPGKTWAGLAGGIASAAIAGAIGASFTPYPYSIFACAALAALLGIVSQGGDLFESWLKRRAGVKDSGSLIPGHGGVLDRVDGLIFALPLFAALVYFSGS